MQTGRRWCCTTIPNPTQKAFSRKLHFQLDFRTRAVVIFQLQTLHLIKYVCIFAFIYRCWGAIKMAVGKFSIQMLWEEMSWTIFMQKALFRAKIDLFRERVSELERCWKFHLEMQIGKVLFLYIRLPFCMTGGKQRRFMLMLWIVGTIPRQNAHGYKPSPWWPKMICELCFTWTIDNLGKQKSTVVSLKCKQRSWWNNKTNDTQCLRSTRPVSPTS